MNLNTGLLLIHANDTFKEDLFNKYLSNIKISSRRNPINVFIAGNEEINRWNSLRDKIEKDYTDRFQFIYPSIEGSNIDKGKYVTINQLYSRYVFAQDIVEIKKNEYGQEYIIPQPSKILISFDEISVDSFKYMWSMFKSFQFQDAEKLVFIFYPRKKDDTEFVKEKFIKTLYRMSPEITPQIESKIKIDFLDNRSISPVDMGGR